MESASAIEAINAYSPCVVCMEFVKDAYKGLGTSSEWRIDKMFSDWAKHQKSSVCLKFGKTRTHVGNGRHNGAWAFTITKSPQDSYSVGDMLTAVRKVMSQKSVPVVRYAWYYEDKGRDANGDPIHPHIHGMYETESGGRIERKHWKRAWSIWDETKPMGAGFRGGYHRPVRTEEKYSDYIAKDGGMGETSLGDTFE